ncbi:MAG: 23S rRNA (pseudouridine(1915)-N(3))-methyltransferase RlmH [Saccharofermentanales bacterium]
MKISIIAIGKIKEDWMKEGIAEYSKRISKFCKTEIIEIPDEPDGVSASRAIEEEGRKMLARIKPNDLVIALDLNGDPTDSIQMADRLSRWMESGGAKITFLIAGSNGYSKEVLQRSAERIKLSDLTFPHQMTRLIFLEQLYRSFKIINGEKYHK